MKVLGLSLGHNASAGLIEDGNILCAYENERLTGIKSDSQFPIHAIRRIIELYDLSDLKYIVVGHWFLDGQLPDDDPKHWKPDIIKDLFPKAEVLSLSKDFSHHDSHMLSAEVFAGMTEDHYALVADGFGTEGECISVYFISNGASTLARRIYGFNRSVGMWYQYSTEYMGMKPHQDEWKALGYETHIDEYISNVHYVQDMRELLVDFYYESYMRLDTHETSLSSLIKTKKFVYESLESMIVGYKDEREKRVLASFLTQLHTENILRRLFLYFKPVNLIVSGGCFYNVKINSMLADMTSGKFSAMPLAGDQAGWLGVYEYYFKDLKWPNHLFWGHRDQIDTPCIGIKQGGYNQVLGELSLWSIVNIIRGSMEYGPRALCHTSTLALPTLTNVDIINAMNGRDTVMPFALVVTRKQAEDLFEDVNKIHKSLEYMIITRRFKPGKHIGLEGGAHYYPLHNKWTCRLQITDDPFMIRLLEEFGPLINTSFNYHGTPIVFNKRQIEYSHNMERKKFPIATVLVED